VIIFGLTLVNFSSFIFNGFYISKHFGPVNFPVMAKAQGMSLYVTFIQQLDSVELNTFHPSDPSFGSQENLQGEVSQDP
jgi:hypothetical protein